MKNIALKLLFTIGILFYTVQPSFSQDPPPPPPDDPSSGGGPVGGGAPVGEALVFTLLLAAGYGARKYYGRHKRSITED